MGDLSLFDCCGFSTCWVSRIYQIFWRSNCPCLFSYRYHYSLLFHTVSFKAESLSEVPTLESQQFIITGCPGSGKTTLINYLRDIGFTCVDEPARQVIAEQRAIQGNGLSNKNSFVGLGCDGWGPLSIVSQVMQASQLQN